MVKLRRNKTNNDCFSSEQQNQPVIVILDRLKIGNITFYYIIQEIFSCMWPPTSGNTIKLMNTEWVCESVLGTNQNKSLWNH